jgi:hypothetical protein
MMRNTQIILIKQLNKKYQNKYSIEQIGQKAKTLSENESYSQSKNSSLIKKVTKTITIIE